MGATHYFENNILPGQIYHKWNGRVWHTVSVNPTALGRMTPRERSQEVGTAVVLGTVGLPVGVLVVALATQDANQAAYITKTVVRVVDDVATRSKDVEHVTTHAMSNMRSADMHMISDLREVARVTMGWHLPAENVIGLREKYGERGYVKAFQYDALQVIQQSKLSASLTGCYGGGFGMDGTFLEVNGGPTVVGPDATHHAKVIPGNIKLVEHKYMAFQTRWLRQDDFTAESYASYFGREQRRNRWGSVGTIACNSDYGALGSTLH